MGRSIEREGGDDEKGVQGEMRWGSAPLAPPALSLARASGSTHTQRSDQHGEHHTRAQRSDQRAARVASRSRQQGERSTRLAGAHTHTSSFACTRIGAAAAMLTVSGGAGGASAPGFGLALAGLCSLLARCSLSLLAKPCSTRDVGCCVGRVCAPYSRSVRSLAASPFFFFSVCTMARGVAGAGALESTLLSALTRAARRQAIQPRYIRHRVHILLTLPRSTARDLAR